MGHSCTDHGTRKQSLIVAMRLALACAASRVHSDLFRTSSVRLVSVTFFSISTIRGEELGGGAATDEGAAGVAAMGAARVDMAEAQKSVRLRQEAGGRC